MNNSNRLKQSSHPKDTWWSWVVLGAAFLSQTIIFGLLLCFGIYFVTLLDYFQCTKAEIAVVGSVLYGTKCLNGLLASILYRKFGCQIVVMTGGLISAIGCLLSYFARDLFHLVITYGLINGFGLGLVYTPTIGILPDYFDKHRYFATAFTTVGSAVGTLIFQPIFLAMINLYGWQGSMIINAGFSLQIVVFGSLMKSQSSDSHLRFSSLLEISLLRNLKFWLLMLDCILWAGAVYIVFSMANGLMMVHGIEKSATAYLATALGFGNTFGRLSSSVIGNFAQTNRPVFYAVATLSFGISALVLAAFCQTAVAFGVFYVVYGFFFGCMLSQLAGVIMDLFGTPKLVNGIGYAMFACGIGGVVLVPVAGTIAESFGIQAAYYTSGIMSIVAAALCFATVSLHRSEQKRIEEHEMVFRGVPHD